MRDGRGKTIQENETNSRGREKRERGGKTAWDRGLDQGVYIESPGDVPEVGVGLMKVLLVSWVTAALAAVCLAAP